MSPRTPPWTEDQLLRELRRHGARSLQRVRFRENRSTIWSVTGNGRRLNLHAGYRDAPTALVRQFAVLVRESVRPAGRRGQAYRHAAGAVRGWPGLRRALERVRRRPRPRRRRRPVDTRPATPGPCCATPAQRRFLRRLYLQLARKRFDDMLPDDTFLRLSRRMTSRLGQMLGDHRGGPGRPGSGRAGEPSGRRRVVEIVLSLDLMLPGNEAELVDTLLHEMAHAADWLRSGGRGHGPTWKAWARRVGCHDRACSDGRVRRRRRPSDPVERVPDIDLGKL